MTDKTSYDFVINNRLCVGCSACTQTSGGQQKIQMGLDATGFLRPQRSGPWSAGEDNEFAAVCPGLAVRHSERNQYWTDLWGPVISSHVGWATCHQTRLNASSGGGITGTLCYLIDGGHVDAVLHVGADENDPLRSVYKISTSAEQIKSNTGSRYAPAAPLQGLSAAMSKHDRIALVGKPCDIVAARNLARTSEPVARQLKYFISFMCAGTPSSHGTDAVLDRLGVAPDEVTKFRYRGHGWPGRATASLNSGEDKSMSYAESWGSVLNKHLQVRCKVCIDGTGEFADITFADAWYGGDDGYPSFEEEAGRSLILVRTAVGAALLKDATAAGYLQVEPLELSEVEKMQPYQAVRKRLMLSRVLAMKLFGLKPPRYDKQNMFRLALRAGLKNNLISFFGMARRVYRIKRSER